MAEAPVAIPHVVSRKRRWYIALGIIVVVSISSILAVGAVWLVRSSSVPPVPEVTVSPNALPNANETESPVNEGLTESTPVVSPIPAVFLVPPGQNNLAVTIQYTRLPSFSLAIANIQRTGASPTIESYKPVLDSPYSVIRITDAQGAVLLEQPFAVTTGVEGVGQGFDEDATAAADTGAPLYELPSSTTYMVIPVQVGQSPAQVEILTAAGVVVDTRSFTFTALPVDRGVAPVNLVPTPTAFLQRYWRQFTQLVMPISWAQTPAPGECAEDPCFVIAVVGAQADRLQKVTATVKSMVAQTEPWVTYRDHVAVVPVLSPPDHDLRCIRAKIGKSYYPQCPDEGAVAQVLTSIQWNTIIVVWPGTGDCDCGSVANVFASNIATVGAKVSVGVVAHEFGHSVGRMVDEYMYKYGTTHGPRDGNCFKDKAECGAALDGLGLGPQGGVTTCAQGCYATHQWRPSNRLMHNEYTILDYGPLEKCIMAKKLNAVIGRENPFGNCETSGNDPVSHPPVPPPPPGTPPVPDNSVDGSVPIQGPTPTDTPRPGQEPVQPPGYYGGSR